MRKASGGTKNPSAIEVLERRVADLDKRLAEETERRVRAESAPRWVYYPAPYQYPWYVYPNYIPYQSPTCGTITIGCHAGSGTVTTSPNGSTQFMPTTGYYNSNLVTTPNVQSFLTAGNSGGGSC